MKQDSVKQKKHKKKVKNTQESDFSGNEIPDLNSFKHFGFEWKANIGDIIKSQKQPAEVFFKKSCP